MRNDRPDAIVRPGWELNGTWFWWAPRDTEVWKQCFRQVVTAIRSTAPHVQIDWNMTGHRNRMQNGGRVWDAYPGDDVVDIVSIDAYDSYPASTSQETFDDNCNSDSGACTVSRFARQHSKQFAVPEWGMDHRKGGGGDNPYYIEKMYELFASNQDILAYEAYYSVGAQEAENVQSALTPDLNPNAAQRYLELFGKPATVPSSMATGCPSSLDQRNLKREFAAGDPWFQARLVGDQEEFWRRLAPGRGWT
ncbi:MULTISPECIES: glycoside hydrolase family 26 protein [unclassified Frankia]